ncbi:recombinase family protein [Aestuariibius sp. 2305UL40-4]|uniref:recombinase family protein n=1 Tax=Aestuariibius violaceus TaxID=3234132 RepID=UPI00398F33E4
MTTEFLGGPSRSCRGRRIGYVRVSDKDQTEALQIDALRQAGCTVIYGDHGVSGAITTRRGLADLIDSLRSGDTLVVWKLDRLGRSTIHLLQLLADLRARKIDFIALTQGIDTTTAVGRMLCGQLAVFAEFERDLISDRTKAGMAAAKRRGKHVGRPKALTEGQIRRARRQIDRKGASVRQLASRLKVTPQTLARAIKRIRAH